MKICIRTAHGYLSFQPDGRLEYRDVAGPWENIDVEGLELVAPPAPGPDPPPAPGVPAPPPIEAPIGLVPSPTGQYVAAVKAQLQTQGVDLTGPCGAFAITKRVAWGLRFLGIGLVTKPGGNQCEGYSVDWLCYPNGDGADILGDAGGTNTPQWSAKAGEFAGQDRWRAPVQP